jgi:hypothetical protein
MDARDSSELAALAARIDELSQVCARLSRENADLRDLVSRRGPGTGLPVARSVRAGTEPAAVPQHGKVSRRMIGKALGATAAGMIGASALVDAGAGPAAAADGDSMIAGAVTRAESLTELKFDGGGSPVMIFLVNDTDTSATASSHPAVLGGWAGGLTPNGIYGFSSVEAADGVVGQIDPGNSSGNGLHGIASGPGTIAILGENSSGTAISGSGGTGVKGVGSKVGVVGAGPTAIEASASGKTGIGVKAGGAARGGVFSGSAAQVRLSPGTMPTHPKSGKRGDLYADSKGRLWFCKTTGTAATWHQIA